MSEKRRQKNASWRDIPAPKLHGREKLGFALKHFRVDVGRRVAFDCGASTGGFTQALLDGGARRVYAVDAGYGQLLGSLRQDQRVVNLERTNLADASIPECIEVVTLDLSYLSLSDALPQLPLELTDHAVLLALVKPMFELRLGRLPGDQRAGLSESVELVRAAALGCGWSDIEWVESPLTGRHGAIEGFIRARR